MNRSGLWKNNRSHTINLAQICVFKRVAYFILLFGTLCWLVSINLRMMIGYSSEEGLRRHKYAGRRLGAHMICLGGSSVWPKDLVRVSATKKTERKKQYETPAICLLSY